jgi:hypothetical protein
MKSSKIAFYPKIVDEQRVCLEVIDENGDVRDTYLLSLGAAGNLSRELQDCCDQIIVRHGDRLPQQSIASVSGRH